MKKNIIFTKNKNLIVNNPIFITGVYRSGTSILGKLIGSMKNIEYEFEPLMTQRILLLEEITDIDSSITKKLLQNYLDELLYNKLIGRNINLKPTDDSLFLNINTWKNLFTRWNREEDRNKIKNYIEKDKIKLAIKNPNLSIFYTRILKNFQNSKLIIIYRNGFDVMDSLVRKGWLTDSNLNNKNMLMPRKETENDLLIPWWVEKRKENEFINWNVYTRSLYMWRHLNEIGLKKLNNLKENKNKHVLEIKFEDFVNKPKKITKQLCEFINTKQSNKTAEVIEKINPEIARFKKPPKNKIHSEEFKQAKKLNKKLGYDF